MRQELIEENEMLKKQPKTNVNLEMIEENDKTIKDLTSIGIDEMIKQDREQNKSVNQIAEEKLALDKLYSAMLNNAMAEAFKFIIPAADDLTMYDWKRKKLIEEGYSHLIEPRIAVTWFEDDDNQFYEPVAPDEENKTPYIGPWTFSFICSELGIGHRRIRNRIEDLIDMPKEEIELAYTRFRNMNSIEPFGMEENCNV